MNNDIFEGVADTLFIPLAARVEISKRFPEYFYDEKALGIGNAEAVRRIAEKSSEYSMVASVARYYNMDRIVTSFIEKNGKCGIVNLGAGLETMNARVRKDGARFYEVDFPGVIEKRRKILGEADNETLIGCDITGLKWTEHVDKSLPVMPVVSGVFQYFKETVVLEFISNVQNAFKNAEMVFDAANEFGIKYAEKHVKKTGNMSAMMYFYINDPDEFARKAGVEIIGVQGFFDAARKMIGKKTALFTRIAMKVADDKKRTLLLHIKL